MAFLAATCLIQASSADLTNNSLYYSSTIAVFKNDSEYEPALSDRINLLYIRYQNLGKAYLDQLRIYLFANASNWSDIPTSSCGVFHRDNIDKKTFWS